MSRNKSPRVEKQRAYAFQQEVRRRMFGLQQAMEYRDLVNRVYGEIEVLKKFDEAGELLGADVVRALTREGQGLKRRLAGAQALVIERGLSAIGFGEAALAAPAPDLESDENRDDLRSLIAAQNPDDLDRLYDAEFENVGIAAEVPTSVAPASLNAVDLG